MGGDTGTEMVRFFATAVIEVPELHFLILTQGPREEIQAELRACGVEDSRYSLGRATPGELGEYLAAADFGISFIRPDPSKASSSPNQDR